MESRWRLDLRWPRQRGRPLILIPLVLIVVISVVDMLAPPEVHLGPLLVAAPAITASFAGPWTTIAVGAAAVLAQGIVAAARTTLVDLNHSVQIVALALISLLVALFAHLREQHEKEMTQLRSVAEAAQAVLQRPVPARMGPLRIASVYLAAEAEAQIGGDLYAAVRTRQGSRFLIGDVRGKGLEAIGEASLVLGAFRTAAYRQVDLPVLVSHLEGAVFGGLGETGDPAHDTADADDTESFITAAVLDIPDTEPVIRLADCGHPAPLLLRGDRVTPLDVSRPAPPLGLTELAGSSGLEVETFAFEPGDIALLYTDGVIEARDESGAFYPLAERLASWAPSDPHALLRRLCQDLLAHAGGRLGDDAAMVAIKRDTTATGNG
ncbi:serine/threonine-protein phosphatase [Streptomyces sp. CB01881]|nr:PP2C family protein-serine/threonine phosphatase [Streptomyces sp. CB01881]AUY53441.1 protein phosphatase [Streptomyces sp. CB01881]TYC69593.1 serine/threonine-protein phosphatase [Streptomyces sp. CB01881]